MIVLIGSRRFAQLYPSSSRIQKRCSDKADWDFLVGSEVTEKTLDSYKRIYGPRVEFHVNPVLHSYMEANDLTEIDGNLLLTLKASHLPFHRIHKKKTFYDIYLLSKQGNVVIEPLFHALYKYWIVKFGEPWRADFTKESADFFDDAVSRENVHDELHEAMAQFEKPAFRYVQYPSQTTVWVCPKLWKEVDEIIRQRVVIEEAQTLALERFILPKDLYDRDNHVHYVTFIEGLVDRLAPLWMVPYICDNFAYFIDYRENFTAKYFNYVHSIEI